jgi:uncharacterized protein
MYNPIDELKTIPQRYRTLFAASCAERLVPTYLAFCIIERWSRPEILEDALEYVWSSIKRGEYEETVVSALIQTCEQLAPDSEDFATLFTGPAINAVGAVYYSLKSLIEDTSEHAQHAGQVAIEAIYDYLYEMSRPYITVGIRDPSMDAWLNDAPLLKSEIQIQQETLALLRAMPVIDEPFVLYVRKMSAEVGIKPIERGLVRQ